MELQIAPIDAIAIVTLPVASWLLTTSTLQPHRSVVVLATPVKELSKKWWEIQLATHATNDPLA